MSPRTTAEFAVFQARAHVGQSSRERIVGSPRCCTRVLHDPLFNLLCTRCRGATASMLAAYRSRHGSGASIAAAFNLLHSASSHMILQDGSEVCQKRPWLEYMMARG